MKMTTLLAALGLATSVVLAQQPANPLAPYLKIQAPVIALIHARVIDGTGAPARPLGCR